jgi:choline kinase
MITLEKEGERNTVTILDDTGQDEEVMFIWDEGGDLFYISQKNFEGDDPVIAITKLQAAILKDVLNDIIVED